MLRYRGRRPLSAHHAMCFPDSAPLRKYRVYTGYTTERFFDRTTMQEELGEAVRHFLGRGKRRVGLEAESAPIAVMPLLSEPWINVTPWLAEMRRRKDADEIAWVFAQRLLVTEAGYDAARKRCEPGMTEYEVYSIISEANGFGSRDGRGTERRFCLRYTRNQQWRSADSEGD